ncbi:MAG: hypothetical protein WC313_10095 [Candidatus Kapaibacterium sp.]|nr:hypothetical protein [Candidatus Kapabacteria bacterium]
MKLIYYEIVEDCVESKNVYDAYLSMNVDINFLEHLKESGKLHVIDVEEKKYFKIIKRGKYTIRGMVGDDVFRILMPDDAGVESLDTIKKIVNEYNKTSN